MGETTHSRFKPRSGAVRYGSSPSESSQSPSRHSSTNDASADRYNGYRHGSSSSHGLPENHKNAASNMDKSQDSTAGLSKEELVRRQIKEKLSKINITKKLLPVTTKLGIKPLTVDSLGRVLDESGNVMKHRPMMHSSLKINQNFEKERQQKEALSAAATQEKAKTEKEAKKAVQSQYVDPSLNAVKKRRRMALNFVEPGSYIKQERQLQRQMEDKAAGVNHKSVQGQKKRILELQDRRLNAKHRLEVAEERGLAPEEVTENLEEVNPNLIPIKGASRLENKDSWDDDEPWLEWWDRGVIILKTGEDPFKTANARKHQTLDISPELCMINDKKFNCYIEHPAKLDGRKRKGKETPAIMLTKDERKKLRRRKRQEMFKKIQDKIRVGLIPPPPPKLKLSNLMRVLKDASVADPSKVEKQVREQMEERLRNHEKRNEERKLTPEQRSKKHAKKWQVGKNEEVEAALFTVKSLENPKLLFKVDINAQQLHLTGCCIVASHVPSIVVVEGSKLSIKRYIKLLMRRIKWEEAAMPEGEAPVGTDTIGKFCRQIWTGSVRKRNFSHWSVAFAECDEEITEALKPFKAVHYYEMVQKYRDPMEDI
ncbi:U4/U6-associated RNA splicing factor-related protein [Babesia gibsoni]|uniref:U4/U6-associated RNA splicing factor-related protein n=1 Tax=Babesia gibsoni TaxID=33632 RepID=A0AAD8PCX2_BABGI|nr:U4/U6-associated RNA splicing factor-related protein [Babesia gibsoni]